MGTGCGLGAPRSPPSEIQVSIQGSHVQSTTVFWETALQATCSGAPACASGWGQTQTKSHCSDTTRAPALPLALWPSEWSPRVPDGLRDEWTSPSCLYPAQAWTDCHTLPQGATRLP